MPFHQRVRLPIHAYTPQFPTEATRFRKADGSTVTQSVVIRKTYNLRTDMMGESMHQKLVIALNHDDVTIEGDKYIGGITVDGDYSIDWPDFMDYPIGPASVLIQVTPFDATNSNCQTCDVLTQLELVDDDAGEIAEGAEATVGVYGNDSICCFPIEAEIVSFNTAYLDSATIDEETGVVTLTAKDPANSVGSIVMATYRVTCPDGTYDEADVYASIAGSEPACEQPSGIDVGFSVDGPPFTITMLIGSPVSPPSGGYEWMLYEASAPGVPIDSGTDADNTIEFSVPGADTEYIFSVRSVCGDGVYSPYTNVNFTTPEGDESQTCGMFTVICNDHTVENNHYAYSYMDCSGEIQNRIISNLATSNQCMLMDENFVPVYFQDNSGFIGWEFEDLC